MSVEASSVRGWSRSLYPAALACWPIARTGLLLVMRRRMFWFLLALALFNFLFMFATIYLKAQIVVQNPGVRRFVDRLLSDVAGTGETYRDFMFAQGTVTMMLLAFAGAMLIGDDLRQGGLAFYLARRVQRWHYVAGKLLAIGLLVSLTTTFPALALFVEYGALTESLDYFRDNLSIVRGILGYGLVLALCLGLILFALAAWLQRTVPLVMAWACLFVLLPVVGALLRRVYGNNYWLLLGLWRDIRLVGTWCFGGIDTDREMQLLHPSLGIVAAACVVSLVAIIPRVRAVRVVE